MIAGKYHAIVFLSILVMLLLLGLQLLGFGFGSGAGQSSAAGAAGLVRNSTSSSSSQQTTYRHPITYDKLTGATNNQINEVLGAPTGQPQRSDGPQLPIDHYAQRAHSPTTQQNNFAQQPSPIHRGVFPLNPFGDEPVVDSFVHRPPVAFPTPGSQHHMMRPPPIGAHNHHHHHHHHRVQPVVQMAGQTASTTQAPPARFMLAANQDFESIPQATSTSVASNNASQQQSGLAHHQQQPQQQQQQQQQQQPAYYTPPIFTYSQFPVGDYQTQSQKQQQQQHLAPFGGLSGAHIPPLGVPEAPMSVEEYAERSALNRLRQANGPGEEPNSNGGAGPNLLADPIAQQRHRQQMLSLAPAVPQQSQSFAIPDNSNGNKTAGIGTGAYYPDPALYSVPAVVRPPPYAAVTAQLENNAPKHSGAQNRLLTVASLPSTNQQHQQQQAQPVRQQQHQPAPQTPRLVTQAQPISSGSNIEPQCARQNSPQTPNTSSGSSMESANSTGQMPVMFCNEDPEYPTNDIMRALETYALGSSIEQLLPQQLVQLLLAASAPAAKANGQLDFQRQLVLDPLQVNINAASGQMPRSNQDSSVWFPSGNYEPMCRAANYIAQPRRAKNLAGQWKVLVNLPGHKYRGIAVSQMVRIEECTRPNSECSGGQSTLSPSTTTLSASQTNTVTKQMVPRSRCLQQYENQRLLAWSHQQGLHMDLFRLPTACSCHIRRIN